jgi:hypothetical protein
MRPRPRRPLQILEIQLFHVKATVLLVPEMYGCYVLLQKIICLSLLWYLRKLEFKHFEIQLFHVIAIVLSVPEKQDCYVLILIIKYVFESSEIFD